MIVTHGVVEEGKEKGLSQCGAWVRPQEKRGGTRARQEQLFERYSKIQEKSL